MSSVAQVEHENLYSCTLSPLASPTSSILVAQVGKSPDVGQVHGKAYHRQEEVDLLPPGLPVFLLTGVFLAGGCSHKGRGGELNPVLLLYQDQLHLESHSVVKTLSTGVSGFFFFYCSNISNLAGAIITVL